MVVVSLSGAVIESFRVNHAYFFALLQDYQEAETHMGQKWLQIIYNRQYC